MKRFVFLWGSLFFTLVFFSYSITMCLLFSAWFLLFIIPSFFVIIKLIQNIGIQAKVLTQIQKSNLSKSVYRQGCLSFLISVWCAFFVSHHPYEHCIYAATFGVALFCFSMLCFALRSHLNSFNSLWKRKKEKSERIRSSMKFSNSIILFKKLKSMIMIGLIGMQQNL